MAAQRDLSYIADTLKRSFGGQSILDTLVPGYSAVSSVLTAYMGIDISSLVPWLGVFFALSKISNHFYARLRYLAYKWLLCSISLTSDLESYRYVTQYLAEKKSIGPMSSSLMAISNRQHNGSYVDIQLQREQNQMRGTRRIKFTQDYEPSAGYYQHFWHNGRMFIWFKEQDRRATGDMMGHRTAEARLYCLSMTAGPIKQLIAEAITYHEAKTAGFTSIYRPCSVKQRAYADCHWRTNTTRPSRPMNTVILDKTKKANLIADVQQYLLPTTRKWYAQRGIPYRRGYLFHGSPGTGKTSLSFALAGLLDLDIYCLSLAEKTMTESDLFELFETLPRQCLVLLEDIDTAGLQKRDDKDIGVESSDVVETTIIPGITTKAASPATGISLSGLLNAIDGVASHEGRVLIMTTNNVNALDPALLRPGRIDTKFYFGKSTTQDAYDLFVQSFMEYDGDSIDENQEVPKQLGLLAQQFASKIPSEKHTPAEIQGYLLTWKNKKPEDAVAHLASWLSGEETAETKDLISNEEK